MADLISRAWILAEYDRQHQGPPGGARKIMAEAPTVDAVPVVRCKDCRYWRQEVGPTVHWVCAQHSFDERYMYTMPDFFCAFGERR